VCKVCGRAEMTAMVAAGSLDTNHNTLPLSAALCRCRGLPPFYCFPCYLSLQQHISYFRCSHWRRAA
jgi:hypothetical protein